MGADFMNLFDTAIENNADEILLNYIRKILPSLSAMADKIEKGKRDTVDFYEILLSVPNLFSKVSIDCLARATWKLFKAIN